MEAYASFLDAEVWPMAGAEGAELAKLAETTYRDLNIAAASLGVLLIIAVMATASTNRSGPSPIAATA